MDWNTIFEFYISSIITAFAELYVWNKLMRKNAKLYNFYNILVILTLSIFMSINYFLNGGFFRMIVITIICALVIRICYRESFSKCLGAAIFSQLLLVISESIFATIILNTRKLDFNVIKEMYFGKVFSNLSIAVISLLIVQLTSVKKIMNESLSIVNNINKKYLFIIFFTLIASINFLFALFYYQINFNFLMIIAGIIVLIYAFITLRIIFIEDSTSRIKAEYDNLLDKSAEYETIIDKNRRDTHENRNDLIVLDGLISPKNKKAKAQLHAMIKDYDKIESELRGNQDLYHKTLSIPSGGLRGLIYHKLIKIESLNIQYDLRIGRNINSRSLKKVNHNLIRQYGKLVGIYLDNAIDAVKDLDEKLINIEIFIEDGYFCLLVANNFVGELDIEKLGKMGYSSKGGIHGYGLSLSKEILKENKRLSNETAIYKDILSQVTKLKL